MVRGSMLNMGRPLLASRRLTVMHPLAPPEDAMATLHSCSRPMEQCPTMLSPSSSPHTESRPTPVELCAADEPELCRELLGRTVVELMPDGDMEACSVAAA